MADQFSEISSESWFGRIGSSIVGILFGFIFILVSLALLSWNEGRSVKTAKSLQEGAASVVSVEPSPVNPSNENKLIHVSGQVITSDELLKDPAFAITAHVIRLSRNVAMYQWKEEEKSETKNKLGGGTETVKTFSYEETWSDKRIDSSKFKHPQDHTNPAAMIAQNYTAIAQQVSLGCQLCGPLALAETS
jgi:Transmembrane protein 43